MPRLLSFDRLGRLVSSTTSRDGQAATVTVGWDKASRPVGLAITPYEAYHNTTLHLI